MQLPFIANQPPLTVFAISFGSVVVGALFLREGWRWLREAFERRSAPSVPARIISSRIARGPDVPTDKGYSETWLLAVAYDYTVRRRIFSGTRVASTKPSFTSWWDAMWERRKYEPGADANVYFDPKAPEEAILKLRLTLGSLLIYLSVGTAFAVVGVLGLGVLAGVGRS